MHLKKPSLTTKQQKQQQDVKENKKNALALKRFRVLNPQRVKSRSIYAKIVAITSFNY